MSWKAPRHRVAATALLARPVERLLELLDLIGRRRTPAGGDERQEAQGRDVVDEPARAVRAKPLRGS